MEPTIEYALKNIQEKENRTLKISSKDIARCKGSKRLEGEDFEKYKKRRKVENWLVKMYLRGHVN